MPAAPADSPLYARLFNDPETARLFTDAAETRAMMLVEGALARVQGALGLIPAEAAAFIDRAAREGEVDAGALAAATAVNGVPVPGFVTAFGAAMKAPDHARYLHWGATSQDIMDSALMLRLARVLDLWDARIGALLGQLADLAETHATLPMAARTYGQNATPTSFGAVVAGWGQPILAHRARLRALRPRLPVSLGGAAGTLSAMGAQGPQVRAGLAAALGLADPGASWHAERSLIGEVAAAMAALAVSLGKMGEDLILLTQSGIGEVRLAGAGGSSTMPQKQNPVGPSVLVALARHCVALAGEVQGAGLHRQNRDGAAWFVEWLTLPQLTICTGRALALAGEVVAAVTPDGTAMARGLAAEGGVIGAEALSFLLAEALPRPEAQARVKALCAEVAATGVPLATLAARDFPTLNLPARMAGAGLGTAPADARAFAAAVRGA